MEENINERLSELGTKILATTRNELYIHMRFLDVALSSFAYVIDPSVNGVGTDGMCMFYHPGALGGLYKSSRVRLQWNPLLITGIENVSIWYRQGLEKIHTGRLKRS